MRFPCIMSLWHDCFLSVSLLSFLLLLVDRSFALFPPRNLINGLHYNGRRIFIIINIPNHTIPTSLSCCPCSLFLTSCRGHFPLVFLQLAHIHPVFSFSLVPSIETNTHMPRVISSSLFSVVFPCSPPRSHIPPHTFSLLLYVLDETRGRGAQ